MLKCNIDKGSSMQFDQTLAVERRPEDPEHDPAGDSIQCHELESGELLLTFSDDWCAVNDYVLGDVVSFIIDEEDGKLTLVNKTRHERAGSQDADT